MTITREELLTIAHQKGCVTAVNPETGGSFLNFTSDDLMNFANHFYELGRKMQRESDSRIVELDGDTNRYNLAMRIRNNTGELK